MIRVNECCCGCSLRTGTLILLWLHLIDAIFALYACLQYKLFIFVIIPFIGMFAAIYGMKGISRNIAKYLTPQLYVMYIKAVLTIFILPLTFQRVFTPALCLLLVIISLAVQGYFCVVVRSYRDFLQEKAAAECLIRNSHAPSSYTEV